MFSLELLLFVDEAEDKDVVCLGLEVGNTFNIHLELIILLNSDVQVLSVLALNHHKSVLIALLDPVSKLLAHRVCEVLDLTLDVRLA
jgi:hypothetical protein